LLSDSSHSDDSESYLELQSVDSAQDNFICRICEEVVPLDMIEEHSKECIRAHRRQFQFYRCNSRLIPIRTEVAGLLESPWPGEQETAVSVVFPVLAFHSLISYAIDVELNDPDASDRLAAISARLENFSVPDAVSSMIPRFLSGKLQVDLKLSACSVASPRRTFPIEPNITEFAFIGRLSSGAFARVYLSRKISTGDLFAVKVIKKCAISLKNQISKVSEERDIMRKLRSPYVVTFFYSFTGKNNLYIVMEYIPGGDLFSLLEKFGGLPEDAARTYAAQIVAALKFLREHKVVHRDLKPDNCLITASGNLKLADFGLSFFGAAGVDGSNPVGTPDYMAPEMVMARPHQFEVDYWSLGAMLFEMLCGVAPFHGDDPSATFSNIILGVIDWGMLDDVSEAAVDLLKGLLTFDPAKRLGAKDISEIMDHAWFRGINWDEVHSLPPVFVPESSKVDSYTMYFVDRSYEFGNRDETDIREDLEVAKEGTAPPDEGSGFYAVALESLAASNEELAAKLGRKRRRISGATESDSADLGSDELNSSG
jgi:serine/threonine protein kinase